MPNIEMINCHIHTFTHKHTPIYYPHPVVVIFRWFPWLIRALRWLAQFGPRRIYDRLVRLENFHDTGARKTQAAVLKEAMRHYPRNTKFVVLPMDMGLIGHGPVEEDIDAQHTELAGLARDPELGSAVIPFATVYPDRPGAAQAFRDLVTQRGFRGLKLYPKLGYPPTHDVLMEEVYPFCEANGLPVVSHCSRGGVQGKAIAASDALRWSAPAAFEPVMRAFPDLRISLAHFGGQHDWLRYLKEGADPFAERPREATWITATADRIASGDWPNLWTDISYTIFYSERFIPLLYAYLDHPKVRERILFGSDFYMTRQERFSEREISLRLRHALGEENFRQIAEVNPRAWLGMEPLAAG